MREIAVSFFLIVGVLFSLLAVLGILKMPDLFTRLQSTTKASTLGIGCMLLAVAFYFGTPPIAIKCLVAIIFFFITQPIAAHLLSRAAYLQKTPLWENTIVDELKGHYDPVSHELEPELTFDEQSGEAASEKDVID